MQTRPAFSVPNGPLKTLHEGVLLQPLLSIKEILVSEPFTPCPDLPRAHIVAGYRRTSHIVPAACPRSLPPQAPLRQQFKDGSSGDAKTMSKALIDAKLAFEGEEMRNKCRGASNAVMWNCVDRYVPAKPAVDQHKAGLTLFLTHANGSPRQIWEPTLEHLLKKMQGHPSVAIDEIWSFESVQHGDSALFNEHNLSDVFDWQDQCRDILNFLLNYLPQRSDTASLPVQLERVTTAPGATRRCVTGIGHSYGGTTLARAALAEPDLFHRLILVEPMIVPPSFTRGKGLDLLLKSALSKVQRWPSRSHAKQAFLQHPATKTWDPAVIDTFVEHGLVECGDDSSSPQSVRLKTSPFDEAVVYCEWNVCYEAWTGLKDLDMRIALHWIMSARTNVTTGGEAMTQETVWRRTCNTTNVRLPEAGHLAVHEAPEAVASEILNALSSEEPKSML
ncbi:alpha/beta-hydrolase [Laetiporus sulphureus 93-53]|uniref:Alpha/beta-hydrolase n=1 Tax=Laetiporus sulphureus 93-53 TaxID=1314785 RepID=A0A165B6U3_9APHY|nr:alpha/beta-hydrolase [Laetiporus sulphureus 93-53]KZT00375.1 alpha/beta-hydrolase [Laetiporus sulphureus 93-53]